MHFLTKPVQYAYSEDSNMTYVDAAIYANGILILNAINAIAVNRFITLGWVNGMKVRIAVCSLIYRKVTSNISLNGMCFPLQAVQFGISHPIFNIAGTSIITNRIKQHRTRKSCQFIIE